MTVIEAKNYVFGGRMAISHCVQTPGHNVADVKFLNSILKRRFSMAEEVWKTTHDHLTS